MNASIRSSVTRSVRWYHRFDSKVMVRVVAFSEALYPSTFERPTTVPPRKLRVAAPLTRCTAEWTIKSLLRPAS
jgi:hypothetical protein